MIWKSYINALLAILVAITLVACASKESSDTSQKPVYKVNVDVKQLAADAAIMLLVNSEQVPIDKNGSFDLAINEGEDFKVEIDTDPDNQVCTFQLDGDILNFLTTDNIIVEGALGSQNVNLLISCITHYSLSGVATDVASSGLEIHYVVTRDGELEPVAQNTIPVSSDGLIDLGSDFLTGDQYEVSLFKTAPEYNCLIQKGTGSIESANVEFSVKCALGPTYTLGGNINNLEPNTTGITLQIDNGSDLTRTTNTYTFVDQLIVGTYTVSIASDPVFPTQICTFSNGTKTIDVTIVDASIANLDIDCVTSTFTISGTVDGLSSTNLIIASDLEGVTLNSDGTNAQTFTFNTPVMDGDYPLSIQSPTNPSQNCTFNATGSENHTVRVRGSNVTNVAVSCVDNLYIISGNITGLDNDSLKLDLTSSDPTVASQTLTPSKQAGPYSFNPVPDGNYTIDITNPVSSTGNPQQTCTFAQGSVSSITKTVQGANVTGNNINCSTDQFDVSVDIDKTALADDPLGTLGVVLVQNGNTLETKTINNGTVLPMTFSTKLDDRSNYTVTVVTQPDLQQCLFPGNEDSFSTNIGATIENKVTIPCVKAQTFTITGTASGLLSADTMTVTLSDATNPSIQTDTITDQNPGYAFNQLPGGDYTIAISTEALDHDCSFVTNGLVTIDVNALNASTIENINCDQQTDALVVSVADTSLANCISTLSVTTPLVKDVRSLTCDGQNPAVTNLTGIDQLANLETLILNNNGLTDLTVLASLTKLKKLELRNNLITDAALPALSAVSIPTLIDLNLGNDPALTNQNSVNSVSVNVNLTKLNMDNNNPVAKIDLTGIGGMTQLQNLSLVGNSLDSSDLVVIAAVSTITNINVSNNTIGDVTNLSTMTQLTTLNLKNSSAALTNVSVLTSFTNPVTIDLSGNSQMDCNDLSALISNYAQGVVAPTDTNNVQNCTPPVTPPPPEEFTVSGTFVQGADGLTSTTEGLILELTVDGTTTYQLTVNGAPTNFAFTPPAVVPSGSTYTITVIQQPTDTAVPPVFDSVCEVTAGGSGTATANITDVQVDCNVDPGVNVVAALNTQSGVTGDIVNQCISLLPGVDDTTTMTQVGTSTSFGMRLDCAGTNISDLSGIQFLTQITSLNLDNNQISDLTPLVKMPQLVELSVANNQINTLPSASVLAQFSNLTSLSLASNNIVNVASLVGISFADSAPGGLPDPTLILSGNQIIDVQPLASLLSLKVLDLSDNNIGGGANEGVGNVESLEAFTGSASMSSTGAAIRLESNALMACAELENLTDAFTTAGINPNPVSPTDTNNSRDPEDPNPDNSLANCTLYTPDTGTDPTDPPTDPTDPGTGDGTDLAASL